MFFMSRSLPLSDSILRISLTGASAEMCPACARLDGEGNCPASSDHWFRMQRKWWIWSSVNSIIRSTFPSNWHWGWGDPTNLCVTVTCKDHDPPCVLEPFDVNRRLSVKCSVAVPCFLMLQVVHDFVAEIVEWKQKLLCIVLPPSTCVNSDIKTVHDDALRKCVRHPGGGCSLC